MSAERDKGGGGPSRDAGRDPLVRPAPVRLRQAPSDAPGGRSPAPALTLLLVALVLAALLVFVVLPRWGARPVVATEAAPVPAPRAAGSVALPRPAAQDDPPVTAEPPGPEPKRRPAPGRAAPAAPPRGPSPVPGGDFDLAVSAGLAALDRHDWPGARDAFSKAEAAQPGSATVREGLERAEAGLRAAALAEHRDLGAAAEAREEWRAALAEYEQALKLDPAVRFAEEGRARSLRRAALDERLEGYLARPDRLSAEAVAREAEASLEAAEELEAPGPRLRRQAAALRQFLAEAREPVPVRLVSDGRTAVTILRVGSQGAFKERELELRPGRYAVVGTRPGYRDTRRTLVIAPGRPPEPLLVRCDEEL